MTESGDEISTQTVVVVGAGGNIGSHLVPHLGRMPGIARVTLVDRDVYERSNLCTQNIEAFDLNMPKAVVQARRLRRINPSAQVRALHQSVERIPVGLLRADVILACLDSRRARQWVNQVAWRLGVPWIDAGVEGGGLLARVNIYVPGTKNPCLQCAWDQRDYEALEQTYPCSGENHAPPSGSPSSLGALAASLQAIECQKLLRGGAGGTAGGKQVLIDALHHKLYVTSFRHNPVCRFGDHKIWRIHPISLPPERISLSEALGRGKKTGRREATLGLRVEGKPFVKKLTCPECGSRKSLLRLEASLKPRERKCAICGRPMVATGFDLVERLTEGSLTKAVCSRSLRRLGLRTGDVISIGNASYETHFEIGRDRV